MRKNLFLFNQLLLIIIFSLFSQLLFLSPSIYALNVFNKVLPTGAIETLIGLTVLFLALAAFGALFDYVRRTSLVQISTWIYTQMMPKALEIDAMSTGLNLIKSQEDTATSRVEQVTGFLRQGSFLNIVDAFYSIFFIFLIFLIDLRLGLYVLLSWILLLSLSLWFHRHNVRTDANKKLTVWRRTGMQLMRLKYWLLISGKTRAFSNYYYNRVKNKADGASQDLTRAQRQQSSLSGLRILMQMGVYGMAAYWVSQATLSVGTIIAVALLAGRSLDPLLMFGASLREFKKTCKNWKLIEKSNSILQKDRFPHTKFLHKNMRIHSDFTLKKPEFTLKVANFKVGFGERIHISGASGTGKTLLGHILLGVEPVKEGFATRYFTKTDRVGYVDQSANLFPATLLDNICGSYEKKNQKQIEAVNEVANWFHLQERLSVFNLTLQDIPPAKGLPTALLHDIVLARAFFGSPAFVVLDEPNALISSVRRQWLLAAIEKLTQKGSSCLLLSQEMEETEIWMKTYELRPKREAGLSVSLELLSSRPASLVPTSSQGLNIFSGGL